MENKLDKWMPYYVAIEMEFVRHMQEISLGIPFGNKPSPEQLYEYAKKYREENEKYRMYIPDEIIEHFKPKN